MRASAWRFASMTIEELEYGVAQGPGRLQAQSMRRVGKDYPLHLGQIGCELFAGDAKDWFGLRTLDQENRRQCWRWPCEPRFCLAASPENSNY